MNPSGSTTIVTLRGYYFSGNRPESGFALADIAVPRTNSLVNLTQLTLEAWVKRVNATRNETVVCNDHVWSYCLGFQGGQVVFTTAGAASQVLSSGTVGANVWTHIAATYANGVSQIYINGVLDTSASNPWGIGTSITGSFGIGADLASDYSQNYFQGWIDTVRIWSIARSGNDIRAGMFLELAPNGTSAGLVSEWRLDGSAADYTTNNNNGTAAAGTLPVTDGAIPHDLTIPQVSAAPTLDGSCGPTTEYNGAVQVVDSSSNPPGTYVYMLRTATDLWICFAELTVPPPAWTGDNWAAVYLDPNYTRDSVAQSSQLSLEMHRDGSRLTRSGDGAGGFAATTAYDTEWDGRFLSFNDGILTHNSAEFRISNALLNASAWSDVIGLALAQESISAAGDNRLWPALATDASPATWSAVLLAGTGTARTFSGHVQYKSQGGSVTTGIPGVTVQLIGTALNNTQSIVATAVSGGDGSFSLTASDSYTYHRLALDPNTAPQGMMPYSATGPSPAVSLSSMVLTYNAAGSGTYSGSVFTLTDTRPTPIDQSNAPYFLIIAPQATIAAGALTNFVNYKTRLGFQVELESVEFAIANYSGGNTMEHIRSLEIARHTTYGSRFGYVMLVGSDSTIPFGRLDAGAPSKTDCLSNPGWPSDWVYADLTSNWDTNGDHCYGDGMFGDASAQAKNGFTPDSANVFNLTVAVGRIPIDDPSTVKKALANSMAFEES
ncbi:MAG TPA: LamG-like jellyroll fold domain-containing protein, partial [Terriglobales bacterium]|nr:LamG-like jellyroll fold domain-containing protein [Terriglobales bacterium]